MRVHLAGALMLLAACQRDRETAPSNTGWTAADSARVAAIIAPLVASHEFMGAIALMRDGRVVYTQGAGMANIAAGRAFTPATPADGGSLAKTLTAAAVWTLVHAGRIAIDNSVTACVREYPHPRTTVRQLIAHTNGLPPYYKAFDPHFGPTEIRTTAGLLKVTRRVVPTPRFVPGTRFEYSNVGFDAAALVEVGQLGLADRELKHLAATGDAGHPGFDHCVWSVPPGAVASGTAASAVPNGSGSPTSRATPTTTTTSTSCSSSVGRPATTASM
jgi:CubicO group peptidase (beta-lactamase class C family)